MVLGGEPAYRTALLEQQLAERDRWVISLSLSQPVSLAPCHSCVRDHRRIEELEATVRLLSSSPPTTIEEAQHYDAAVAAPGGKGKGTGGTPQLQPKPRPAMDSVEVGARP